MSFNPGLSMER